MTKNVVVTRLHRRLRELRVAADMTQEDLAHACGVHKTAVSHWETGHSAPRAATMRKVAKALKVSVGDLYDGDKAS